jgi:hypothetical protein
MKRFCTYKTLILSSFAFAAMLTLQSGHADQIRASFERDMQRGFTHSNEQSAVSAAAGDRSNLRDTTSRKPNRTSTVNGSDLIGWCQAPASPYCKGYLLAAADSQQYYRNLCPPENITVREMGQVFVTWSEENPALLEQQAVVLLDIAYKQEWSCS